MTQTQKIVAIAFLYRGKKIFVGKRSATKTFLPGVFDIPGGHVNPGESIEDGLHREIKEELGVDIVVGEKFYEFTYGGNDGNTPTLEAVFFATMKNPDQPIQLDETEYSEYHWCTEDEAIQLLEGNPAEGDVVKRGFEILKTK